MLSVGVVVFVTLLAPDRELTLRSELAAGNFFMGTPYGGRLVWSVRALALRYAASHSLGNPCTYPVWLSERNPPVSDCLLWDIC